MFLAAADICLLVYQQRDYFTTLLSRLLCCTLREAADVTMPSYVAASQLMAYSIHTCRG